MLCRFRQEAAGLPARTSSEELDPAKQKERDEELAAHLEDEEYQMALALSQSASDASRQQARFLEAQITRRTTCRRLHSRQLAQQLGAGSAPGG